MGGGGDGQGVRLGGGGGVGDVRFRCASSFNKPNGLCPELNYQPGYGCPAMMQCSAVQSENTVSADFTGKQILSSGFAEQC